MTVFRNISQTRGGTMSIALKTEPAELEMLTFIAKPSWNCPRIALSGSASAPGEDGYTWLYFPGSETEKLRRGRYVYDIWATVNGGQPVRIVSGNLMVLPSTAPER